MEVHPSPVIYVISSSNERIKVLRSIGEMSNFVKTVIEGTADVTVDSPETSTRTLTLVFEFCRMLYSSDHSFPGKPLPQVIEQPWYRYFDGVPIPDLYQVTKAASMLDIPDLIEMCCIKIAHCIITVSEKNVYVTRS